MLSMPPKENSVRNVTLNAKNPRLTAYIVDATEGQISEGERIEI